LNLFEFIIFNVSNFNFSNIIFFIFLNIFLIYFFIKKTDKEKYMGIQRVHSGEISRCGGLAMFISLNTLYYFTDLVEFSDYRLLMLFILPFMTLIFIEDIFYNISFKVRLFFMVASMLSISFFWLQSFPVVEFIPIVSTFLQVEVVSIIFFSLALVGLMNGVNFVDGMNGLATLTILGAVCGCVNLSYVTNDNDLFMVLVPWIIMLSIFLFFNFPFGKIFLGDSGAYFLAILIGTWLIIFFAKHNDISSWNAALILFYPCIEVIFSIVRKIFQGKSPFYPDRQHLHIKIYDINLKATKNIPFSNNITTLFMGIFWLAPPLMLQFVYSSQIGIIFCLMFLLIIYLIINIFTPSLSDDI
jgi:UDP-N-acetylmuramyl pentapeptide phosphotransferase/UDP-N-acetylglucosamine-1-phosphate transferase